MSARLWAWLKVSAVALVAHGCASTDRARQRVALAEEAVGRLLTASVQKSVGRTVDLDTVQLCLPEGEVEPNLVVSRFRILGSVSLSDTVMVAALVESVVEEVASPIAPQRLLARVRTRVDTLHWATIRQANNRWIVCGLSREFVGTATYGSDYNTDWEPSPSSWSKIASLVDSLRSLPLDDAGPK